MLDLVVVLGDGGVDLLDAEPDAERLLLQRVLLLLQGLDLLHHGLVLLLDLGELGLQRSSDTRAELAVQANDRNDRNSIRIPVIHP